VLPLPLGGADPSDSMAGLYLSHSTLDKEFTQRLADDLKRAGVDVWFENFKPGQSIRESMRQGVENIEYFAFLLSPDSVQPSCLAFQELEWAVQKQARRKTIGKVLPLLLRDTTLPDSLKDILYIDFRDPMNYQEAFDSLLGALGVTAERRTAGPDASRLTRAIPPVTSSTTGHGKPEAGETGSDSDSAQPLSALAYAVIALAGLAIGIGLLFFYVYQVPKLVESGAQNQIFYLLLIPWALACAAFLFGAMKSYARFAHQHLGNYLELGGPVVLFCLVVVGGFKLVPAAPQTFDLTVRPHSADGLNPIITSGKITIDLDTDRRTESIGANGEADFKGIPPRFQGATIKILPQVDGYEEQWQRHKLHGNVLELPLARAGQPVTHLTGSIVPPPVNWKELRVTVEGTAEGKVDELGRFGLDVNGKDGDRVRLKIYAGQQIVYDDYQVLPGPVTLKLHSPH